jgi:hypothetical protein
MKGERGILLRKLSIVVLFILAIFGTAVRPLMQPHGSLDRSLGFRRHIQVVESADAQDVALPVVVAAIVPLPLPALLHLVLKLRRAAHRSVPVRRLKLPRPRNTGSLLPD